MAALDIMFWVRVWILRVVVTHEACHGRPGSCTSEEGDTPTVTNPVMSLERYTTTCYPKMTLLASAVKTLPLSARSLLIKQCQAQTTLDPMDDSPLARLFLQHPEVTFSARQGFKTVDLIHFMSEFEVDPTDPLESSIILDTIRCAPMDGYTMIDARKKGWCTEIKLAETTGRPTINFFPFFFPQCTDDPIHPDIPSNSRSLRKIQHRFRKFRERFEGQILYARATHKNMSSSTRRSFEQTFGASLDNFAIFGQDDWQRVYHEHGILLEGDVEMRQKWYPANAKPRTYFAMGGKCYQRCRFLQDFFSDLVNIFPATNHITRLRPNRLRLSFDDADEDHYRIYDLSSFTSNMKEQKSFIQALVEFMRGVTVIVVDELIGPIERDLGELLEEYAEYCVNSPTLSYERANLFEGLDEHYKREHGMASLLGIFGNLMTCTVAHYLIITPCIDEDDEINIAGDDGLVLETLLNKYQLDVCIGFVGESAEDKTMRSNDLGAVCLKRPLIEARPTVHLGHKITPPNLAVAVSYLMGNTIDPRFQFFNLDEMPFEDRLSVVGKDLLRFLESCFLWGVSEEEASDVVRGFGRVVHKICGFSPRALPLVRSKYVWPLDPRTYNYYELSPLRAYASVCCASLVFHKREVQRSDVGSLRYSGDVTQCNSDRRLVLLERLGYLEKNPLLVTLQGDLAVEFWLKLQAGRYLEPPVYEYSCLKDIPGQFLYDLES